jgi:hypothetical protein
MQFLYPVSPTTTVTQTFAEHVHRAQVNHWQNYTGGIDWAVPTGTPIHAAQAGRVTRVVNDGTGYGVYVRIQHDENYQTLYAHLMDAIVVVDQTVAAGDVIGRSDSTGNATGPHLHFELRQNGTPIDPAPLLVTALVSGEAGARDLGMAVVETGTPPRRWPKLPKLQVVAPIGLHILQGPGTENPVVGYLPLGAEFEAQSKVSRGEDAWLKIGHDQYVPQALDGETLAVWL